MNIFQPKTIVTIIHLLFKALLFALTLKSMTLTYTKLKHKTATSIDYLGGQLPLSR